MTIVQAGNFIKQGYMPCLNDAGFRLINPSNCMFVSCDEDTFMHYTKQLAMKEKTFVVTDISVIYNLIADGWRLCDAGLYKDGITINIEMGVK